LFSGTKPRKRASKKARNTRNEVIHLSKSEIPKRCMFKPKSLISYI